MDNQIQDLKLTFGQFNEFVPFFRNNSKEIAQQLNISVPFFTVDYDFVLEPASA